MRQAVLLVLLTLFTGMRAEAQSAEAHVAGPTDNTRLTDLYTIDQSAREGNNIDWSKLSKDDEQRRQEVHRMLDAGEVRTGIDYFHAAMIFQHGQNPDDYLLAHVLSMDAVAQGSKEARWLSAATLDRYLLSIWQPQVFGTQFHSAAPSAPMTHDKINPSLVSDSMRAATCVVSTATQQKVLDTVNHGGPFASTNLKEGCL